MDKKNGRYGPHNNNSDADKYNNSSPLPPFIRPEDIGPEHAEAAHQFLGTVEGLHHLLASASGIRCEPCERHNIEKLRSAHRQWLKILDQPWPDSEQDCIGYATRAQAQMRKTMDAACEVLAGMKLGSIVLVHRGRP